MPREKFLVPSIGSIDPADRSALVALLLLLLAEDSVAGASLLRSAPKGALDRSVGVGHRRPVGLRLDAKVERPEAGQAQRVGEIGQLERECEVGLHDGRA